MLGGVALASLGVEASTQASPGSRLFGVVRSYALRTVVEFGLRA